MYYYQIFICTAGEYRNPGGYRFICEFCDGGLAAAYLKYMRGKKSYRDNDIIIIKTNTPQPSPDGFRDCVSSSYGEILVLAGEEIF